MALNRSRATIFVPQEVEVFPEGTLITFRGRAQDQEDSAIPSEWLFWAYDDTLFGNGQETRAILPEGAHDVALTAVDNNNRKSSATVSVRVAVMCEGDIELDGDIDGSGVSHLAASSTPGSYRCLHLQRIMVWRIA